jgi:hypothetical protein
LEERRGRDRWGGNGHKGGEEGIREGKEKAMVGKGEGQGFGKEGEEGYLPSPDKNSA